MKTWPTEEEYRTALRIIAEGIQSKPGVVRHTDPALVGWAHVILSQAISEAILRRHKDAQQDYKTAGDAP